MNLQYNSHDSCTAFQIGHWHQRANEKLGNHPQTNQQPLVVRDQAESRPGKLGPSMSVVCDSFPFSALTLLVRQQEGHLARKKLGVGLLMATI